jgi:hypothetical protein
VTGFNAADLEALGAQSIEDLASFTPNLEIVTAGSTTPTFFIRGVGLNDFNPNSSGAVAIYQDDVPLNSPALQLGTLFDMERVNVLKGPQGTGPVAQRLRRRDQALLQEAHRPLQRLPAQRDRQLRLPRLRGRGRGADLRGHPRLAPGLPLHRPRWIHEEPLRRTRRRSRSGRARPGHRRARSVGLDLRRDVELFP